jgi:micrococcal nuclease
MEILIVLVLAAVVLARILGRGTARRRTSAPSARAGPETRWRAPAAAPRAAPPAAPCGPARAPTVLTGKCHVIDGDTIVIGRTKIRLAGIDAPELDQPYGQKAKWAMVRLCKGSVIAAELTGETSYDRLVGTCFLPDGRDLGAELIKQGLALDWALFSNGKYRALEPPGVRRRLRAVAHIAKVEKARRADQPPQSSQRS